MAQPEYIVSISQLLEVTDPITGNSHLLPKQDFDQVVFASAELFCSSMTSRFTGKERQRKFVRCIQPFSKPLPEQQGQEIIDDSRFSVDDYIRRFTSMPTMHLYTTTTSEKRAHDIANGNGYYDYGKDYAIRKLSDDYFEVYLQLPVSTAQRYMDSVV